MKKYCLNTMFLLLNLLLLFVSRTFAQTADTRIYWILVDGGPDGKYYISATETTFDQYDKFCDATGYVKAEANFGRGKQPVINVSVADALAYCHWLSKETGAMVRLPKESEWVYAAQGGSEGDHYVFSGSGNPKEVAWFDENAEEDEYSADVQLTVGRPHIVATKQPNLLGIYDMSGNVWEWCDTTGFAMGGGYQSNGQNCFPYSKSDDLETNYRSSNLGFRVLMKK